MVAAGAIAVRLEGELGGVERRRLRYSLSLWNSTDKKTTASKDRNSLNREIAEDKSRGNKLREKNIDLPAS
jgi:hypothetical protein